MMPQLVTVGFAREKGRPLRLWIPVIPVAILLSPLLVLTVLGGAIACRIFRIGFIHALSVTWRIWCASSGTRVDIEQAGDTAVLIALR